MEDNSHAGQGAVLLDIGGDVGALVVVMPARTPGGVEVEARPVGHHGHHHGDQHRHGDGHGHGHGHSHGHLVHVGVVARPAPDGSVVRSAVFGELTAGTYELYERPAGPTRLVATVVGGEVTEAAWPDPG